MSLVFPATRLHRSRLRSIVGLAFAVSLVVGLTHSPKIPLAPNVAAQAGPAPVLGVERNHFTVNGVPKFLVFFSYFSALVPYQGQSEAQHLATIQSDFRNAKLAGFDGIRMFPNWNGVPSLCDTQPPFNTLMQPDGSLNPTVQARFLNVLAIANQEGLLVDVSGEYASVYGMPWWNLLTGMQNLTALLAGTHRFVFFDLQNEYDYGVDPGNGCPRVAFSPDQMSQLANYVRAIDPGRIVTASRGGDPQIAVNASTNLDILAYHNERLFYPTHPYRTRQPDMTAGQVAALRAVNENRAVADWQPILFQEPERWLWADHPVILGYGQGCIRECTITGTELIRMAQNAKAAGAAGWTFHTETYFKQFPAPGGVFRSPGAPELEFVSRLNSEVVAQTAWGIAAQRGALDNPGQGATVPTTFGVGGWILDLAWAGAGSGITAVTIGRTNLDGSNPVIIGNATIGIARPDVAAAYGAQYSNPGFHATVTFPPGQYLLHVVGTSQISNAWGPIMSRPINVQ
jgi:hypothetical protein